MKINKVLMFVLVFGILFSTLISAGFFRENKNIQASPNYVSDEEQMPEYVYDTNDNLVAIVYTPSQSPYSISKILYEYDANGNVIKEEKIYLINGMPFSYVTQYGYNAEGDLVLYASPVENLKYEYANGLTSKVILNNEYNTTYDHDEYNRTTCVNCREDASGDPVEAVYENETSDNIVSVYNKDYPEYSLTQNFVDGEFIGKEFVNGAEFEYQKDEEGNVIGVKDKAYLGYDLIYDECTTRKAYYINGQYNSSAITSASSFIDANKNSGLEISFNIDKANLSEYNYSFFYLCLPFNSINKTSKYNVLRINQGSIASNNVKWSAEFNSGMCIDVMDEVIDSLDEENDLSLKIIDVNNPVSDIVETSENLIIGNISNGLAFSKEEISLDFNFLYTDDSEVYDENCTLVSDDGENYDYNEFGLIENISDEEGNVKTQYVYDSEGRLLQIKYADGTSEKYVYGQGGLFSIVDTQGYISYLSPLDYETMLTIDELMALFTAANDTCSEIGMEIPTGLGYYCSEDLQLLQKKDDASFCENDFECQSGKCSNNECINRFKEVEKNTGLLKTALCKVIHPLSKDNECACIYGIERTSEDYIRCVSEGVENFLDIQLITPDKNQFEIKNGNTFKVKMNVTCRNADCGYVEVGLDPETLPSPENPTLTINVLSNPMPASFVVENHYTDMVSIGSATFTGYAVGENIIIRYFGPISEYRFVWGGDCAGTPLNSGICSLTMSGDKTVAVSVTEACGDGVCDSGENINDCYKDCDVSTPLQACAGGIAGLRSQCYGYFRDSENYYNCGSIHECWGGNCYNCYVDYDRCMVNKNAKCFVVGDGNCGLGENSENSEDCIEYCGDGTCNNGETSATCPEDCEVTGNICGDGTCDNDETELICPEDCFAPNLNPNKGLVSDTFNAQPFFTYNQNPRTFSLDKGETKEIEWEVVANSETELNKIFDFFVYASSLKFSEYIESNHFNVTIVNYNPNSTNSMTCGNNVLDYEEKCDGNIFGNNSCKSRGYLGGELLCSNDCQNILEGRCIDYSCGNEICEGGETNVNCPEDCSNINFTLINYSSENGEFKKIFNDEILDSLIYSDEVKLSNTDKAKMLEEDNVYYTATSNELVNGIKVNYNIKESSSKLSNIHINVSANSEDAIGLYVWNSTNWEIFDFAYPGQNNLDANVFFDFGKYVYYNEFDILIAGKSVNIDKVSLTVDSRVKDECASVSQCSAPSNNYYCLSQNSCHLVPVCELSASGSSCVFAEECTECSRCDIMTGRCMATCNFNDICDSGENSVSCANDCNNGPLCSDSDNGRNYPVKGTITGLNGNEISQTVSDRCSDSNNLVEFVCSGNYITNTNFACSCFDGRCI